MSLSSLFPIVAIIVLNCVKDPTVRLGLMAVFTVAFSFCLGLFSTARKAEIFSASAAFAAVQVVFIGGNGTGGSVPNSTGGFNYTVPGT